nr:hypothetical protein [uncultured Desulfobacter sp.]
MKKQIALAAAAIFITTLFTGFAQAGIAAAIPTAGPRPITMTQTMSLKA